MKSGSRSEGKQKKTIQIAHWIEKRCVQVESLHLLFSFLLATRREDVDWLKPEGGGETPGGQKQDKSKNNRLLPPGSGKPCGESLLALSRLHVHRKRKDKVRRHLFGLERMVGGVEGLGFFSFSHLFGMLGGNGALH